MRKENAPVFRHESDRITDGFDIFFWIFNDASSYVPTHWHTALEISYVLEGSVDNEIGGHVTHLVPGDVSVIDSTVLHSTKSIHGNRAVLIQLPFPILERYIPDFNELSFSFDCHATDLESRKKRAALIDVIEQMIFLFENRPKGVEMKFNSLTFELMYRLYQNFSRPKEEDTLILGQKNFDHIKKILKYSDAHYKEPITLAEIAAVAAFQEDYFCHFFKKHMGITYFQYLNKVRLSHVYKDLISTDLPLKDILDKHGFANYKVFRRMFAEEFHTTPGQYRKEYSEMGR